MEDKEKYKQLDLLVDKITARLVSAEEENISLLARVRMLESSVKVLESSQSTVTALKEWRDVTNSVLKKLYTKIDKEISRIEEQVATPKLDK